MERHQAQIELDKSKIQSAIDAYNASDKTPQLRKLTKK
jgi:hypothetical protein